MRAILERVADYSGQLESITRPRVVEYLASGNSAETFENTLSSFERTSLAGLRTLLLSNPFSETIDTGRVTFGMIRPRLDLGRKEGSDSEIADMVLSKIRGRFRVVLNLPWPVGEDAFSQFYGHVKDRLTGPATAPDGTSSTVWKLFLRYGIDGATSFLILDKKSQQRNPKLQTWQLWRTFIGATQPSQAQPGTLRREFGSDYNNIVHGSDSRDSVQSDIRWMAEQLPPR